MKYTPKQLDEIDVLLAEHVMGWTFRERLDEHRGIRQVEALAPDDTNPRFDKSEEVSSSRWAGAWHLGSVPQYTRSGDAMLEVVEKMRAEYHIHMEGHWRGPWTVEFCQPSREWSATAPTLPLAVALAALAAVGHPYKEHGHA